MEYKGKRGPDHHNWKGGRTLNTQGYVLINVTCDPLYKGKYQMLEHRYVMEKYIGRRLKKKECVHHINEKKDDNRIENLEILTWSAHARLHPFKGKHISNRWIKCFHCGMEFYSRKTKLGRQRFCSIKCGGLGRKGIRTTQIKKRKCPNCKKTFKPIFNSEKSRFCSIPCANKSRTQLLLDRKCSQCGKWFLPGTRRNSSKQRFCSIICGVHSRHQ